MVYSPLSTFWKTIILREMGNCLLLTDIRYLQLKLELLITFVIECQCHLRLQFRREINHKNVKNTT